MAYNIYSKTDFKPVVKHDRTLAINQAKKVHNQRAKFNSENDGHLYEPRSVRPGDPVAMAQAGQKRGGFRPMVHKPIFSK